MPPTKFRVNWSFIQEKTRKIDFQVAAMAATLDFRSEWFYLFLIYKSPQYFLPSFESTGLLVQEKKQKTDFQNGHRWPSWISDPNDFKFFYLPVTPMLPTKFPVKLAFGFTRRSKKVDFQDGHHHSGHLGFPIGMILANFDLQVTRTLPTEFRINWPFSSGEKAKNKFSKWPPWTFLTILDLQVTPMHPIKFRANWPFNWGKKRKTDFQDGRHGDHLGFPIRTILAIFDLQVTSMLPTKFRVNWPFGSEEEVKNRFLRWQLWRQSWISDRNSFSYFWFTSYPSASYQVSSQMAFRFRRRSEKYTFKMSAMAAILDFRSERL